MAKKSETTDVREEAPHAEGRVEVISFDLRRNLINILGEEHYPYAEFLYHELAANGYDEDATEVMISEEPVQRPARGQPGTYRIVIRDNGNGMDFALLKEYFTVGESGKPGREISETMHRRLIGRLGVGKVSILKVARQWRVTTERHLGLPEPVRLTVHVDVDQWINGGLSAFAVQYVEPTGRPGTEIVLDDVRTKLRDDRILRHLQRLPLGDDFRIWRNGELVRPREWYGVDKIDIDAQVTWEGPAGEVATGPIHGEIWVRPPSGGRDAAYIAEPSNVKDGLAREPAGVEIRVDGDMITREFFGHEMHAHQVNRIWGWVEVPWLPILGNRTDYQRDTPEGRAMVEAVEPLFMQAYNKVRYEGDRRTKSKAKPKAGGEGDASSEEQEGGGRSEGANDPVAVRYAEGLNALLEDHPELTPLVQAPAVTSPGRPAKSRIYPARPTGRETGFTPAPHGKDRGLRKEKVAGTATAVVAGVAGPEKGSTEKVELAEMVVNTKAGIRLRFSALGALEAPYRWNFDDPEDLALDLNTDHKLYQATGRPGGDKHRLYCAWVVSLAMAERANPTAGAVIADLVENLSYELFSEWSKKRG